MTLHTALVFSLLAVALRAGATELVIVNPDMESGDAVPSGWLGKFGLCEVRRDTSVFHGGHASLCVDRSKVTGSKGSAHQMIAVTPGLKITLDGWVKSAGNVKVKFAAHFFDDAFTWNEFQEILGVEGKHDWEQGSKELTVPEKATQVAVALYVEGEGKAWLDDVALASPDAKVSIALAEPDPAPPKPPSEAKLIPTTPLPGYYADYPKAWMMMHESNMARARQGGVDLLFLGDSITQGWNRAPEVFAKAFGSYSVANFGIGGDTTGNVLWRLDHGEVDGLSPKLVVLMIGVNNMWSGLNSADEIAVGIRAVADRLKQKLPSTKVLLLGVLPTGERPDNPSRSIIAAINAELSKLPTSDHQRFLDVGDAFLQPDKTISKDIMADFLHPTARGYELLASRISPVVEEMMK